MSITTTITRAAATSLRFVKNNANIILAVKGATGVVSTTVLAVKATPKALEAIDMAEREKKDKLTTWEKVKVCWKHYLPAAVDGVVNIAAILGGCYISEKKNAALLASVLASEEAIKTYKDTVAEIVPEEKVKEIEDKFIDKRLKESPLPKEMKDLNTPEKGSMEDYICFEPYTGQYFLGNKKSIGYLENHINKILIRWDVCTMNDVLNEVDRDEIRMGNMLGWTSQDGDIEILYSTKLKDGDTPCLAIDFSPAPHRLSDHDSCPF